jgi:hypothetical protein
MRSEELDRSGVSQDSGSGAGSVAETTRLHHSRAGDESLARCRGFAWVAGLIAGVVAFGLGEAVDQWHAPELVPQNLSGGEVMVETFETIAEADARNAALAFGLLGGSLGLAFGLAGGMAGGSVIRGLMAAGGGLVLGSLLGVILPLIVVVPYFKLQQWRNSDDLLVPLAMHSLIWGMLGAVGGLAWGLGRGGEILRPVLFALVGACLGTAGFEALGAAIDPLALTTDPVSKTWPTRLLARILVATTVGVMVGLSVRPRDRLPAS